MITGEKMISQFETNPYFKNIFKATYNTKKQFISYWHQINEIIERKPSTILEIGIGNGFVSKYLKDKNFNIVTLDIEKRLKPDKVGSVLDIPFIENCFDVVACYEVLEHIEYKYFRKALSEMYRVCKKYVIISLPDVSRVYIVFIHIPKIGIIKRLVPMPTLKKRKHQFDGAHYWEIGKLYYPLSRIKEDIFNEGFHILKTYRVFENIYHRFFVLTKNV